MKELIRSSSNKNIKLVKALQMKKTRDEQNLFIIEGEKLLKEALDYNVNISFALLSENYTEQPKSEELTAVLESKGVPILFAENRIFGEAGETETPQGILAVAEKLCFDFDVVTEQDALCFLLLDGVRDPGNVGTIVRTADACGIDAVILTKGCADLYNGKTIRSTMGSLFHIPVFQNADPVETLKVFREKGIVTIGAAPRSEMNCIEMQDFEKSAIIIGNESQGIRSETMLLLDYKVNIPMPGRAESLNAGIAAAIMMYEIAVRKKYSK
ncbi:MAG: TrmH family RNA methyltransferase [Caulobacteraceae bacterium]